MLRAAIALFQGDLSRWLSLLHKVLEILPPAEVFGRSSARVNLTRAFMWSGEVSGDTEHLIRQAALAHDANDLMTRFNIAVTIAELQRRQGRLRQSATTYREAMEVAPEPGGLQTLINSAAY